MLPRTTSKITRLSVKWSHTSWSKDISLARIGRERSGSRAARGRRLKLLAQSAPAGLPFESPALIVVSKKPLIFRLNRTSKNMNNSSAHSGRPRAGFTLIELLVVIAIIGVLASMALPVLSRAKVKAQVAKAQMEIRDLAAAISAYQTTYGRLPASKDTLESLEDPAQTPDFTFGTFYRGGFWPNKANVPQVVQTQGIRRGQKNNSEVVAILQDMEYFRDGSATPNVGHSLNPQKINFLNAKETGGVINPNVLPRNPGVGPDGVYRDPWGNPYIISLDLNYDDRCRDGFYSLDTVSATAPGSRSGHNGLFKESARPNTFEYRGSVMVWSLGPDGAVDPTRPAGQGANKDNILSWK
jgi:general secretion pathway protein G